MSFKGICSASPDLKFDIVVLNNQIHNKWWRLITLITITTFCVALLFIVSILNVTDKANKLASIFAVEKYLCARPQVER